MILTEEQIKKINELYAPMHRELDEVIRRHASKNRAALSAIKNPNPKQILPAAPIGEIADKYIKEAYARQLRDGHWHERR